MTGRTDAAVSAPTLARLTLTGDVFTARVTAGGHRPVIELKIDGRTAGTATLEPIADGVYRLSAPLPRHCLCDGDVAVVFQDRASGAGLATYLVSSGYPQAGDLLAELAALRAEFEALKRAFLAEAWHEKLRKADRSLILAEVMEAVAGHLREREAGAGS